MPIKPNDFLTVAKDIKDLQSEPAYRVTVSRAYYACFHHSKEMAGTLDETNITGGVHAKHISKFTNATNFKTKSIGYKMKQFHSMRIDSDYDLDAIIGVTDAEQAIEMAERIMEDIDKIS